MKDKSCRGFLSILRLLHVSMSCGHSYERKLSAHIKAHANVSKDYISRNFSSKKTSFVLSFHVSSLPNKEKESVWKRHMKDNKTRDFLKEENNHKGFKGERYFSFFLFFKKRKIDQVVRTSQGSILKEMHVRK